MSNLPLALQSSRRRPFYQRHPRAVGLAAYVLFVALASLVAYLKAGAW